MKKCAICGKEINGGFPVEKECLTELQKDLKRQTDIKNKLREHNAELKKIIKAYLKKIEELVAENEWQAVFKKIAQEFVKSPKGVFLAAGQSGAGKTHICTAIAGELLKQNYPVKYMRWKDESTAIKAVIMDDDRYERLINPLKTIQVLYIDDFWKTKKNEEPKAGDINLAFEILNYRIGQKELVTIISTEKTREELFDIDEAVAGRIFQFAGDFAVVIKPEKEKNYRRRDEE